MGGRIIVQQEKSRDQTQLDEPTECASGGDPLRLHKILQVHTLHLAGGAYVDMFYP
jgi:hypothetical protein